MSQPPKRFTDFLKQHPDVGAAYKSLGAATMAAGPLSRNTAQLVKLGIAVGMRHEGAVHAHARKALDAGCTPEEIRHAVMLATTTLGFPAMMAALSWVDDIIDDAAGA
ncbi:MAG: carboxymuconolactone decarboxylase family protein [Rhodothermales bacterium]|nr:carboxymuconolactone decarboxylase family protein [Rhodothermales bacterium]